MKQNTLILTIVSAAMFGLFGSVLGPLGILGGIIVGGYFGYKLTTDKKYASAANKRNAELRHIFLYLLMGILGFLMFNIVGAIAGVVIAYLIIKRQKKGKKWYQF